MTTPDNTAPEQSEGQTPTDTPKPSSLEDLLAAMDEDSRKVVLGEVSKARTEAKGLRDRLKAAEPKVTEYDRLLEASKTDQERAQEALTSSNQRATALEQRLARAEVRAALAGVVDNPDAIVDDLNLSRFVGEDGEVDANAIAALRQKYAGFSSPRPPRPDGSQASGANGRSTSSPADEFASLLQNTLRR
jgi:hypothetical protein